MSKKTFEEPRNDFTEKLGTALDEFWPKLVEAREKFGV